MNAKTLYERLGGYDAIAAVAGNLLPRMQADPQLARFYQHRPEDSLKRSKQLLIDFLCSSAGGPVYYNRQPLHCACEIVINTGGRELPSPPGQRWRCCRRRCRFF